MLLSISPLQERHGLEIVDHVERRQCSIHTQTPVEIEETSVEEFPYPVDRGVKIETESVNLPYRTPVFVRNSLGFQVEELTKGQQCELPEDRYTLEMSGPVKLYIVVESALEIEISTGQVDFEMESPSEVLIGTRSNHKNPAGTITTTEDPEDMMTAISMLSSALKSTTPERSYPTLRGHPPTIELGDSLDIPDILEKPDTGVTIEIPRDRRHAYVVAPLAYYLGADVEPGPIPRVITDNGFEHQLEDPARGFEGEVERVLKQTFFLDCLTRTEGYYQVNLHERNKLESKIDLDFEALYEASMGEQLEAYLSVPFSILESEIPEWKLTAHVSMTPKNIEVLPFVINDLAIVQSPNGKQLETQSKAVAKAEFTRTGDFMRSSARGDRASAESAPSPSLIKPEGADSLDQAWVGEGAPVGASKAMIEAYRNRLQREPEEGNIEITVICNDSAMNSERDIVDEIYGSREEIPYDIQSHHELSVEELRSVLRRESDFLHYIGHIDDRGFECADGYLDASSLEHTGVESFLLNACTSYQQGMELIRAGSVAGVVTVKDVINSGAERIGSSMAKLLNHGFPFSAALTIAKNQSIVGGQYLVLGDGGVDIAQSDSGVPALNRVAVDEYHELSYQTFLTFDKGIGTMTYPHVSDNDEFYLAGGSTGEFQLSESELIDFLTTQKQPIRFNNNLFWPDSASYDELTDRLG